MGLFGFKTVWMPPPVPSHPDFYRWRNTFRAIAGTETDPDAVAALLTAAWVKP